MSEQPCRNSNRSAPGGWQRLITALGHWWNPGADANHHFDALAWARHRRRVAAMDRRQGTSPRAVLDGLHARPLISLFAGWDGTEPDTALIASLRAQIYPDWEVLLPGPAAAIHDTRMRIVPKGDLQAALAASGGAWCAFLEPGCTLPADALLRAVAAAEAFGQAAMIYGDEDRIDARGRPSDPWFKPALNPELLLGRNLMSGLCLIRRELLQQTGGPDPSYPGAELHDLALRCVEVLAPDAVVHVPRPLCHRRAADDAQSGALQSGCRAVEAHLRRRGISARTEPQQDPPAVRVHFAAPATQPLISVLIPTRNGLSLLEPCIGSLLEQTRYPQIEILIADNGSDDPATLRYLAGLSREHGNLRVLRCDYPFNYSRLNNDLAAQAKGEFLVLMNNDIEVVSPGWAEEMLSLAALPGAGCIGARLHFPDGRLQHAGVVLGTGFGADHVPTLLSRESSGHHGRARLLQRVSAVTGAVLMLRRETFAAVGGLDADELAVAWNDIDLCLKVQERGLANLWTPHAVFVHHEGASRGRDDTPEKKALFMRECAVMQRRWALAEQLDPFYNPNLARRYPGFELANPPGDLSARRAGAVHRQKAR